MFLRSGRKIGLVVSNNDYRRVCNAAALLAIAVVVVVVPSFGPWRICMSMRGPHDGGGLKRDVSY